MSTHEIPKTAFFTVEPEVVAAWMTTAEQIRDIQNRAVDAAEKIGKNKGLMIQQSFGAMRVVGLAPVDPKDPPAGWRYVRQQFEPRRGKAGEAAASWLASVQPPSMRDVMKAHGLPRHCSFKYGFFGTPAMFQHEGAIWALYKGEPDGEASAAWTECKPSQFYAAQEAQQEAEKAAEAVTRLLEPMLTDRPDSGWRYDPANPQDCSYRDDTAHDHDQCLEQMAAGAERAIQLVRAHVEDNGGYRVFEPHRTGAGFLTYDHTNGDYGYIEASGALSQDFVAESEERLCWEALQRGGEDAVFEHLEHLYRRLSPAPRSEQERTSTRG